MACEVPAEEVAVNKSNVVPSPQNFHASLTQQSKDYSTIEQADDVFIRNQKHHCYRQKGNVCEHLVFFCSLASASYVGVLSRIYLSVLVNWNGVPLFPSLYPQMVGTVVMGVVVSHKVLLAGNHSFLYQAIATGLCGSITTFSSWNSEAVSTLLQAGQVTPDNGMRVLGWVTTLLLGLGMSAGALTLGRHLSSLSPWADGKQQNKESDTSSMKCCCSVVEPVMFVCMWLVMTAVVVVIPYLLARLDLLFSCLFASLGTYLRWHLSPFNSSFQNFKLGTFVVNVAGAWLLGGVVCGLELYPEGELMHDLLVGAASGFCGCVTTISTFAVELSSLPLWASYVYAFSSIVTAQVGLIIVRGTVQWTSN